MTSTYEALYQAIGGEPDLLDDVLAPDWEDIPGTPDQLPGPDGMKPHIVAFHEAFADARVIIRALRSEFLGVTPNGTDR